MHHHIWPRVVRSKTSSALFNRNHHIPQHSTQEGFRVLALGLRRKHRLRHVCFMPHLCSFRVGIYMRVSQKIGVPKRDPNIRSSLSALPEQAPIFSKHPVHIHAYVFIHTYVCVHVCVAQRILKPSEILSICAAVMGWQPKVSMSLG